MGAALVATGVSAQQAVVKNNCASPIYVQSFPYDGSATGPLTTVAPGQSFSEDFRKSGSVSPPPPQNLDVAKAKANSQFVDRQGRQDQDPDHPSVLRLLLLEQPRLRLLYVTTTSLTFPHPKLTCLSRRAEHRVGQPLRRPAQHSDSRRRLRVVQLRCWPGRLLQHSCAQDCVRLPTASQSGCYHLRLMRRPEVVKMSP